MKYFILCMVAMPFCVMLALMVCVVIMVLCVAFVTWDASVLSFAFHQFTDGMTWVKFRVMYCIGLIVALFGFVMTND